MRILVVDGAARPGGFTRQMAGLLADGAREAGAEVDVARLDELEIGRCRGCFACWDPSEQDPRCALRDDMEDLVERFYRAEALVLATPVYYYSFSALLKIFLERLLVTTRPHPVEGGIPELVRNAMRRPDSGPRVAVLVAVGARRELANMDGLVQTFELAANGLGAAPVGRLLRPESTFLDYPASKPVTRWKIDAAFRQAGRELATLGRIAPETERDAALHLTRDQETFNRHFDTYFEICAELRASPSDRRLLREAAARDLRILMVELAACLDSAAARGVRACVAFELRGRQPGTWSLVIEDGRCAARRGPTAAPDVVVEADADAWVDVILQRVDARELLSRGEIRVRGDLRLFARFGRLFPPQKS